MAKNPNIIYFSLPEKTRLKLSDLSNGEESISLVAKRLLLSALGEDNDVSIPEDTAKTLGADIEELFRRIEIVENRPLKQFEILQRLTALENQLVRLNSLEVAVNDLAYLQNTPVETAIMIQKKPQPEPTVKAEITLTHTEAAKEFEKAVSTIKKWAKSPDQWPKGWIYDGDKQLWIKTA